MAETARVPGELLPHLRRARDLADRDYARPLDLGELAAMAGVSKYHFLRCFAAVYGRTPGVYLAERRVERARSSPSTGPPLDADMAEAIRRSPAAGTMGGFGLTTTDCHETYKDLVAKGVDFTQPPAERPYGIEAVMRDNSGNWLVLVEKREFTGEDFPH
ncbi:VOC family protein [Rhodococcus jostii]|uniref:VOC family protein n=1 Tax=Rhodococcus jostii TaxID=132919 RepID=UPI00362D1052